VSAVTRWHLPDSVAGLFTLALLGGQTAGNISFGLLADQKGHKLPLELGCIAAALAMVIAWIAPAPEWYYAVFVLHGIVLSAVTVSGVLIIMEFSDPARRPTYLGIANTAVGLVSAIAPLVGAVLAGAGYSVLFGAAAVINLLALVLYRRRVREPRTSAPLNLPLP
jgi:MFS family permease